MVLLSVIFYSILFACSLASVFHQPHVAETSPNKISPPPNLLHPRAPFNWISTQTVGEHLKIGNYAITFWKATAILPVVAAASPMVEFYQKATSAAVRAIAGQLVTNSYTFGLGASNLYIDTLDGSPIDWEMMMQFGSEMVEWTHRGWTNHYSAVIKNTVTGVLTVISLEAAGGAALMWLNGGTSRGGAGIVPVGNS